MGLMLPTSVEAGLPTTTPLSDFFPNGTSTLVPGAASWSSSGGTEYVNGWSTGTGRAISANKELIATERRTGIRTGREETVTLYGSSDMKLEV